MKIKHFFVLILILTSFIFFNYVLWADQNPDLLEDKLRAAYRYEEIGLYKTAIDSYQDINTSCFLIYANLKSKPKFKPYLPLLIASVFRQGKVTGKYTSLHLQMLTEKIEFYQNTEFNINHLLKIITDLNLTNSDRLPKTLYNDLFFIRAYNNLGWANSLLQGIAWKNYIVYPLKNICGLVNKAILDLETYLAYDHIASIKNSPQKHLNDAKILTSYNAIYLKYFSNLEYDSLSFKTHRFINFLDDSNLLAAANAKRSYYQVTVLLNYFYLPKEQAIFKKAQNLNTLPEILDKKNQDVFQFINKLTDYIGISE